MKANRFFMTISLLAGVLSYSSAQEAGIIDEQVDTVVISQDEGNDVTATPKTQQDDNAINELYSQVESLKQQQAKHEEDDLIEKKWKRNKYWKIGMALPDVERTDGANMAWKTDFAVFMQRGKSAYLHSKPIAGIMKFAIDFGFIDLTYSKLKFDKVKTSTSGNKPSGSASSGTDGDGFDDIVSGDPDGSILDIAGIKLGMHKIDYAWHVGPSLSINPVDYLFVHTYFHVKPIASGIIENDKFSYGFGVATEAGLSISYKTISVGAEWNWSKLKYKQASFDDDEDDEEGGSIFSTEEFKLKNVCPRVYIAFRF